MVEQANELILDILPLSAQTARLVRVYGTAPCVALPGIKLFGERMGSRMNEFCRLRRNE